MQQQQQQQQQHAAFKRCARCSLMGLSYVLIVKLKSTCWMWQSGCGDQLTSAKLILMAWLMLVYIILYILTTAWVLYGNINVSQTQHACCCKLPRESKIPHLPINGHLGPAILKKKKKKKEKRKRKHNPTRDSSRRDSFSHSSLSGLSYFSFIDFLTTSKETFLPRVQYIGFFGRLLTL